MADEPANDAAASTAAEPASTETKDKIDKSELAAAIVLGIAAVLTAWSSFRASLISDQVVSNYSEMQAKMAESTDLYGNGDQQHAMEQQYFITFALQANSGGPEGGTGEQNAAYLLEVMGPEMAAAVQWWGEQPDPGPVTPFVEENPEYENLLSSQSFAAADEALEQADVHRKAAQQADGDSDRFEMANVFFAVTLFLAGVATLVGDKRITRGLLALGIVMLGIGGYIMVSTPGWSSWS